MQKTTEKGIQGNTLSFSVKKMENDADLYVCCWVEHPGKLHTAYTVLHRVLDAALWPAQILLQVRPVQNHPFHNAGANMSAVAGGKPHTSEKVM